MVSFDDAGPKRVKVKKTKTEEEEEEEPEQEPAPVEEVKDGKVKLYLGKNVHVKPYYFNQAKKKHSNMKNMYVQ